MSALFNASPMVAGKLSYSVSGTVTHYANGLPYLANGTLACTTAVPTYYHQGLPFNANKICVSLSPGVPVRFNDGAMPLTGSIRVAVDEVGAVTHYSSGVPYTATGAIAVTLTPPPNNGIGQELWFDPPDEIDPNFVYDGGTQYSCTAGLAAGLVINHPTVIGGTYQVQFTIDIRTAGGIRGQVGGTNGALMSSAGPYLEDIVAVNETGNLNIRATTTFAGTISDISIVRIS
jgi:hypothetical protein